MRILQLRKAGLHLDLHPYVTVVRGLDEQARAQVIAALAAVPAGGDPGLAGLIEAHGVLFDLTPSALALLDLQAPLDVVVRRSDLPTVANGDRGSVDSRSRAQEAADAARAKLERRQLAVTRAQADLDAAIAARDAGSASGVPLDEQLEDRLAERREARDAAAAARAEAAEAAAGAASALEAADAGIDARRSELEEARHHRHLAADACSYAAAELEASRSARDPFAASALAAAREHLADLEAETARIEAERTTDDGDETPAQIPPPRVATNSSVPDDPDELMAAIEQIREQRAALEAALIAAAGDDRYTVETALNELHSGPPTELIASAEAVALADEIQRMDHQLAALGQPAGNDDDVAAARQKLENARAELYAAEEAVRLPDLDRDSVEELEQTHAELLDALDKAESRFGGKRAQQRLDEAREAERAVLDRLGFNTYADFMMGTSILHVDTVAERRLEDARADLAVAEDEWAAMQADVDAELTRAQLVQRRRNLRERAIALLGRDPGTEIVYALRQHRVEAAAVDDRASRLQDALGRAGLALTDEKLSVDELADLAGVWLAEESESAAHREPLEHALGEAEARLAQLRDRHAEVIEAAGAAEADADRDRRRHSRLDEARAAVVAAEARVARNQEAEGDVIERTAVLETATAREHLASQHLAMAEQNLADAQANADAAVISGSAIAEAVIKAEHALAAAEDEVAQVAAALESARAAAAQGESQSLAHAVAEAQAVYDAADAALTEAEGDPALVATAAASRASADDAQSGSASAAEPADAGDIEWYLLARLAAQRSVSYAGSVPMVLDDALADLDPADVRRVLQRLERMAASVQVVFVSDDPTVAEWATDVGEERAALVSVGA